MCHRGVSSLGAMNSVRQQCRREAPRGKDGAQQQRRRSPSGASLPNSRLLDRTFGGMSILSTRSLLVGVYAAPPGGAGGNHSGGGRVTVVLPSPREKSSTSDSRSRRGDTFDDVTFDGADRDAIGDAAVDDPKRTARPRGGEARGGVALGRCLPRGGMFLFLKRWRRMSKRRFHGGDLDDDDEVSYPPIPEEIFVQLERAGQNDGGAVASSALPLQCHIDVTAQDPNGDRSVWVGAFVHSGRMIGPAQEPRGERCDEAKRLASVPEVEGSATSPCCDEASVASSVILNIDLKSDKPNPVPCVATSSGLVELLPAFHREESSKSASLFNGFYA